jgi:hypothetical protein
MKYYIINHIDNRKIEISRSSAITSLSGVSHNPKVDLEKMEDNAKDGWFQTKKLTFNTLQVEQEKHE